MPEEEPLSPHSPDDTAEFAPQPGPVSLVDELREVHFPTARRGYDRLTVDAYVARVSHRLAELETVNSPQQAVQKALDDVGQQTAAILRQAQETAQEMTARAEAEARTRLEGAVQEATRLVADAEADVRRLDEDTDRIWAERRRMLEDTRRLAEGLLRLADDALERFPPDTGEEELASAEPEEVEAEKGPEAASQPPPALDPVAEADEPSPDEGFAHDDSTVEVLPSPATSAAARPLPGSGPPPGA